MITPSHSVQRVATSSARKSPVAVSCTAAGLALIPAPAWAAEHHPGDLMAALATAFGKGVAYAGAGLAVFFAVVIVGEAVMRRRRK